MRTAAQETSVQIALRNSSEEVRGKDSIYMILVKGWVQSVVAFGAAEGMRPRKPGSRASDFPFV